MNLLVIDFDYFFPNKALTPGVSQTESLLYDWAAQETPFFLEPVWQIRASDFYRAGMPLPRCQENYPEFWRRFRFTDNALGLCCDSNRWAGLVLPTTLGLPGDAWDEIWLFDAHHDCYRSNTEALTCANWMVRHHDRGSVLHVRYPAWRAHRDGTLYDVEKPPVIPVHRHVDDERPLAMTFDAVLTCRSGAWVPAWCDDQWHAWLDAAPLSLPWIDEHVDPGPRTFDDTAAREAATAMRELMEPSRAPSERRHPRA